MQFRTVSSRNPIRASAGVTVLIALACGLCGLVAYQWYRDVDLRMQPEEQKEFARLYSEIDFSQVEAAMQKSAEKIAKLYVDKYCYKVQLSNNLGYITRRVLRDMKEWAHGIRNIQPRHAMQEMNKLSRREFWSLVSEQLQGQ